MAKERLSKLQKWILEKCLKDLYVYYSDVWGFFGKKYSRKKPEFWGKGHDLRKRLGENYKEEFNIEEVEQKYNNGYIWYGIKIYPKDQYCITNSEKAVISRSLKKLVKKGLLIQMRKRSKYMLTEKGFLKVNNNCRCCGIVSYKEYQYKISQLEAGQEKIIKNISESFKNMIA